MLCKDNIWDSIEDLISWSGFIISNISLLFCSFDFEEIIKIFVSRLSIGFMVVGNGLLRLF